MAFKALKLFGRVEGVGAVGGCLACVPYPQVLRFASPDLSATVRELWEIGSTGPEVRELLIDLVQAGRMRDCLDIAVSVAISGAATDIDRVTAISALAEMMDSGGLAALVASLLTDAHWSSRIKEGAIAPLFPKHMTVTDLLGQIEAKRYTVGGIGWTLPRLIPAMKLDRAQVVQFRESLATVIANSVEASEHWPHYTSPFRHLASTLAAVCLAELDFGGTPSIGLVEAAVLAVRLRETEYGDEKPIEQMLARFHQAPRAWRKPSFVAEGRFVAAQVQSRNDVEFGANLTHGTLVGPLDHGDFDWLVKIAADSGVERRTRGAAFWDALFMMRPDRKLDRHRLATIRGLAADEPVWRTKLDEVLKLPKRNRQHQAREAEWKKQSEARAAKQAADIETWVVWRDEVLRDPDA